MSSYFIVRLQQINYAYVLWGTFLYKDAYLRREWQYRNKYFIEKILIYSITKYTRLNIDRFFFKLQQLKLK